MLIWIAISTILSPALLLAVFGTASLLRIRLPERTMARLTQFCAVWGLSSAVTILAFMLVTGQRTIAVEVGDWVALPASHAPHNPADIAAGEIVREQPMATAEGGATPVDHDGTAAADNANHFHFTLKLVFDRLSVPFVIMTFVLCSVIGAFASRYLHLDQGFHRFFVFFAFFQLGMILSSVAGTIETLFFGWELVGLSSALLVAFFHDRPAPVLNGLRVWSVYRIADAAFLVAALTLHHLSGSGDFEILTGQGNWPEGKSIVPEGSALFVGFFLLSAAAGKSALVPFCGWLPRAMEGPTPSSAVFYGALSVHLGAFLLLRVGALLDESLTLRILVISMGATSAIFAALSARVQTDVKSSLAYASLIQVSLIVVEIGFGLRYIPLMHIIGHACLRTLQLVRAPSLLRDYNSMINALGAYLPERTAGRVRLSPAWQSRLYRFAIERGHLDQLLDDWIVRPIVKVFSFADRCEHRMTRLISGQSAGSDSETSSPTGDAR
jgi:Proton-conducting membrane transporter/NADH-Ubiquinone oxidoreductase (complex I), chain 5 N-terminus